jgi:hypothetical protein
VAELHQLDAFVVQQHLGFPFLGDSCPDGGGALTVRGGHVDPDVMVAQ